MNSKIKKVVSRIFKVFWILLGCFLVLSFVTALVHGLTYSGSGIQGIGGAIAAGALIALTLGVLILYAVSTLLFFLIRLIVRKIKMRKR